MPGCRYGRLVLLAEPENGRALVQCDCGRTKLVLFQNCRSGMTRSCGCMAGKKPTHGLSRTTQYQTWVGMLSRCYNRECKGFRYYGGRGIRVCRRWRESVTEFAADVGTRPPGHTLDRRDNDGHYSCGKCEECVANGWTANCRWATAKEQANNQRPAIDSVWLEHDGKRLTASAWARELGITRQAIESRMRHGWPVSKICSSGAPNFAAKLRGRVPGSRKLVHDGIRDCANGWARRLGISASLILYRLKTGRSVAESLTVGRLPRPPRAPSKRTNRRPRAPQPKKPRKATQCSMCQRTGHNKATCQNQIPEAA